MKHTTRSVQIGIVAAVVGVASLTSLAPAQADDNSYLTKLRGTGVVIPLPAGSLVHSGQMVCDHLHRGLRPENETSRYFPSVGMPQIIAAAQSELCPDTLR